MDVLWKVRGKQPPNPLKSRLIAQGSLTERVRETCPLHFHVNVLRQYWASPFADEARLLKLSPFSYARIREVELCCGNNPIVFARTVIPVSSLRGGLRHLLKLGTQPLGEVLFTQRAQRINPQICHLKSNHPLFQMLSIRLEQKPPELWMRRSIFILKNKPLLVQEIFL